MSEKEIVVYRYNEDEQSFTIHHNMVLDNMHHPMGLIYAHCNLPHAKQVMSLNREEGKVYYNHVDRRYTVWFYEAESMTGSPISRENDAIEAISNYILDNISPVIRHHQSFINRIVSENADFFKILECVSNADPSYTITMEG